MARVTVEDCLDKVHNRFSLVLLVSKRAKQLLKGARPTIPMAKNKYIVSSLREVAEGTVNYEIDETQGTFEQQVQRDLNR